jgi:hypothetical protein
METGEGFPSPAWCGTQELEALPSAVSEGMAAVAGRQVDFE